MKNTITATLHINGVCSDIELHTVPIVGEMLCIGDIPLLVKSRVFTVDIVTDERSKPVGYEQRCDLVLH